MCKTFKDLIDHIRLIASRGLADQTQRMFDEEIKAAERRGAQWMRDLVVEEIRKEHDEYQKKRPEMDEFFKILREGGPARDQLLKNDEVMSHLEMQELLVDSYPLTPEDKIARDVMLEQIVAMHMANFQNKED